MRPDKRREKRERESFDRARQSKELEGLFHSPARPQPSRSTKVVYRKPRRVARPDLADYDEVLSVIHDLSQHHQHPRYTHIYRRCTAGFDPHILRTVEQFVTLVRLAESI